jgi:hypothetical protein
MAGFAAFVPRATAAEWVYEISLQPTAAGLERTFSGWEDYDGFSLSEPNGGKTTPNGRLPDDELADLAKLYSERLTEPHELRQKFRGVFTGRMPVDLGGRGDYLVYDSPLGKSYAYLERFRGGDDIDLALSDRRAAVDAVVDIVRDWVDAQVADAPQRAEVRRFFHQELRQDLRKLSLIPLNEAGAAARVGQTIDSRFDDESVVEDFSSRILQYGLERGYVDAEDFAEMRLQLWGADDLENILRLLQKVLVRKTGLDAASTKRLFEILDDEIRLIPSLSEVVDKHPDFKRFAERIERESDGEEKADPLEFLEYLTQKAFLLQTDRQPVRLELSLAGPIEPFATNGVSDPSRAATTHWTRYVGDQGMPTLCYAYWSVPAEAFQTKHFSKVALVGSKLAGAAMLFAQLAPAHRAEMTRHLESLEPGDALRGRVTEFSLVGPADEEAKTTAKTFLELLSEEL